MHGADVPCSKIYLFGLCSGISSKKNRRFSYENSGKKTQHKINMLIIFDFIKMA